MRSGDSGSPIRILLVDDDEVDREAVRRALSKGQLEAVLTEAIDPAAALTTIKKSTFDLILLDHHFPRHDGLFLLRELREIGSRIPVIALTGTDESALAVELMKNGAVDFLPKGGLTPQRLTLGIRNALRLAASDLASRAVQDALKASEELNRRIMELSSEAIEILDAEGRILSLNAAAQHLLDLSDAAEVRLTPWIDRWDVPYRKAAALALKEASAGRSARFVGQSLGAGGKPVWRSAIVAPVLGAAGFVERLVAISSPVDASRIKERGDASEG